MRTELVSDALRMAWFRRRPETGLIVHSDRGSPVLQRRVSGPAQELRHAKLDESPSKLLGQRTDRKPVGIAEAGAHPRQTLCDASRSDGRGNRLVELLQSFALALDVELRHSDAI